MLNFDFATLRLIGLSPVIANQLHALAQELSVTQTAQAGRITSIQRDSIMIDDGHVIHLVRPPLRLLQSLSGLNTSLAVGDWLLFETDVAASASIVAQMPPLTHLARLNNAGQRQALASNVDTALLVMGLDHDYNLRRMERYLALVHAAGVAAVVVLTKSDLCTDVDERLQQTKERLSATVPVFALNGLSADAIAVLKPWLGEGQSLILLGSSGAGKSTLTNTMTASQQATDGVRASDSRGHHTTTSRSLHRCTSGACIIDTPGLRSLQLELDEESLTASFEDIAALAQQCQFRDCAHHTEPGCAVRAVVDADRLKNYEKLLQEARRSQQTPLDKIAARSKWKVLIKSMRANKQERD